MNIRQDIRPVTYLKTMADVVLDPINDGRRSMIITQDEPGRMQTNKRFNV
jgi:hypothetical protein